MMMIAAAMAMPRVHMKRQNPVIRMKHPNVVNARMIPMNVLITMRRAI